MPTMYSHRRAAISVFCAGDIFTWKYKERVNNGRETGKPFPVDFLALRNVLEGRRSTHYGIKRQASPHMWHCVNHTFEQTFLDGKYLSVSFVRVLNRLEFELLKVSENLGIFKIFQMHFKKRCFQSPRKISICDYLHLFVQISLIISVAVIVVLFRN